MNAHSILTPVAVLGVAFALSNCVEVPYDQHRQTTVTSRTYTPGYSVRTLPTGYRTEIVGGSQYYHHNGTYYQPRGSSYVVVDRPHAGPYGDRDVHIIKRLPSGHRVVHHHGNSYYQVGDSYYRSHQNGYMRVSSPF
jgi:hypothetical protein